LIATPSLEQAGGGEQREVPLLSVPPISESAEAKEVSEPRNARGRKDKTFIWEPKGGGRERFVFVKGRKL
jgi:hypothetical protein